MEKRKKKEAKQTLVYDVDKNFYSVCVEVVVLVDDFHSDGKWNFPFFPEKLIRYNTSFGIYLSVTS
jgi:hypothetical protein